MKVWWKFDESLFKFCFCKVLYKNRKAESPTAQVVAPANATAETAPTTEKKINPSLAVLKERKKAQAESESHLTRQT